MNQTEGTMEQLQMFAREGREHLERNMASGLNYVSDMVVPKLQNVLRDRCGKIEERHKLKEPKDRQENFVIHYTSLDTLVSMLQHEAKNRQNATGEQNASLRLYDSVHFNDPDEGNYFFYNLNLPQKYAWLGKKKESHAYIASFIFPAIKKK